MLKLENHLSQELEILYRAWAQKISEYLFFQSLTPLPLPHAPPPPPPPPPPPKNLQIRTFCQNSLQRELKISTLKLFTYFEMLIVPHALHCVDGCCFVFYWLTILVSVFPPLPTSPLHHLQPHNNFTRKLKIRLIGFVLMKLFTHFEMLTVSHAPHCINGQYFLFLSLLTVWYTVLVLVLDSHVSVKQLMSVRNVIEWQYINYMCFEVQRTFRTAHAAFDQGRALKRGWGEGICHLLWWPF